MLVGLPGDDEIPRWVRSPQSADAEAAACVQLSLW